MKHYYLITLLIFNFSLIFGQTLDEDYPKILKSDSDSVYLEFSITPGKLLPIQLKKNPPINTGIDSQPGWFITAYIGNDTIILKNKNYPFQQRTKFLIDTPKGRRALILRFNNTIGFFPEEYIIKNTGKVNFELPEVYELANIIWNLSPAAEKTLGLDLEGDYYEKVKDYFKPYMDHAVFDSLAFYVNETDKNRKVNDDSAIILKYYDFRENSFTYGYGQNGRIVKSENYYYVMGSDWDAYTNLFQQLLPQIEDFAEKSDYRRFYKDNTAYYNGQIEKMKDVLPVKNIWSWLDNEFKKEGGLQSYKIVFSPLIGGSHSTQRYSGSIQKDGKLNYFEEYVMFISGPDGFDKDKNPTNQQRKGLMSGIVFTEIDHHYVNPETDKYRGRVNKIFGDKNKWSKEQNLYNTPISVFNEYMTHSVFSLWVLENFDADTAEYIIEYREEMNAERRGFIKFKEFNRELIRLKKQNPEKKAVDFYVPILDWCSRQ